MAKDNQGLVVDEVFQDSSSVISDQILDQHEPIVERELSSTEDKKSLSRLSSTEAETMRDKIRSRFKKVLSNAELKEKSMRRFSTIVQHTMRKQSSYMQDDDEDQRLESALNQSLMIRYKMKQKMQTMENEKITLPTYEEQMDFFTKNFDESKNADKNDWPLAQFCSAGLKTTSYAEHLFENSNYFHQSLMYSNPLANKKDEENQGIFVPDDPTNIDRYDSAMIQRFYNQPQASKFIQGQRHYFRNGPLILSHYFSKPYSIETFENDLFYEKAHLKCDPVSTDNTFNLLDFYQLNIKVGKLIFLHHPLFSRENVAALRLMQLCGSFWEQSRENLLAYYTAQVLALEERSKIVQDDQVNKELKEFQRLLDFERQSIINLWRKIITCWENLRKLRSEQGYKITPLELMLQKNGETIIKPEDLSPDSDLFDLTPLLSDDGDITAVEKCSKDERQRRKDVSKRKLWIKIFFNGSEVAVTAPKTMNADFCVSFANWYELKVYERPKNLKLELMESDGFTNKKLADIYLPIPKSNQFLDSNSEEKHIKFDEIEFGSTLTEKPNNAAVGAGIAFEVEDQVKLFLNTNAILQYSVLWNKDKNGRILAPLNEPERADSLKLRRTVLKQTIIEDPNRPDSDIDARTEQAKITRKVTFVDQQSGASDLQQASFDPLEVPELTLTSVDEIRDNRRLRLLQLRDQGVGDFRNLKAIPADKWSITDDYFSEFDAQKSKETKNIDLNDLEACQMALASYIADIRENIAKKIMSTQDTKSYSDLVNEIYLPSIGSLGLLFFEDAGRPLKPARVDRQKQPTSGLQSKAQIFVNVLRAQNLPMRSDGNLIDPKVSLQSFVEISYNDQSIRSSRSQGQNATWNQELIFKLEKSNIVYFDITSDQGTLSFDIFDQTASELMEESDSEQESIHTRISRRWLGGFDVAFSSLVLNNVITESFALNVPPSMFGYRFIREDDTREIKNPYLELYLAVDHVDPISALDNLSNLESIETPQLLSRLDTLAADYRKQFPGRRFAPLAVDSNGRTALICRYLSPIKPPEETNHVLTTSEEPDRLRSSMEKCCRIVSLIQSTRDNVCFSGICSLWNSCDQIMATRCADDEEKAVLLYCWLSSLNQSQQQCFLVGGNSGVRGGRTFYVLVRNSMQCQLFDPVDFRSYDVSDNQCPIFSIGFLANQENIWLNIQANDRPNGMSFEVEKEDFWRPFFKKGFANPGLSSLQPTALEYNESNKEKIMELQEKIDKAIKENFVKWRTKHITRWNRYVSSILRELLNSIEADHLRKIDLVEKHHRAMKDITEMYQVYGYPLNQGFSSTKQLLKTIKRTKLYCNGNPDVEFALATHIHAYTNDILSIWIYVVSLEKRFSHRL